MPSSAEALTTLPAGFEEKIVFTGLTNPTAVRFADGGRIFVAEKRGVIKVFDLLTATSPDIFADLNVNVYNFWGRGLLGMTLAPNFPTDPYVYVLYTYDHVLGSSAAAPRWGTPGVWGTWAGTTGKRSTCCRRSARWRTSADHATRVRVGRAAMTAPT